MQEAQEVKRRRSVLLVDDNSAVADMIALYLSREGFSVTQVNDGVQAVDRMRNGGFDLVVTDLDMPRRSGLELIADMRRISPQTRVIVMSGEWIIGGTDTRLIASAMGVRDFLSKPFPLERLLALAQGDPSPAPPPRAGRRAAPTSV